MTTVYVRGQVVTISSTFLDENAEPTTPENPVLHYAFDVSGVTTVDQVDMMESTDGEWTASIDTATADDGIVYWTIRATGVAEEGNFRLVANRANPVAEL